jgi:hypothetical protein
MLGFLVGGLLRPLSNEVSSSAKIIRTPIQYQPNKGNKAVADDELLFQNKLGIMN